MSDSNKTWSFIKDINDNLSELELRSEDGEEAIVVYQERFGDRCAVTLFPAARRKLDLDHKGRERELDFIDKEKFFITIIDANENKEFICQGIYDFELACNLAKIFTQLSFDKATAYAKRKKI
ncbi:hypothetical protein [Methylobacterium sp. Leaf102]|uniref:hypothetical protein n=1 Tax=Methylobacterium sp. Leaf102 TaxID=1736253 RepID=UPI0012E76649|nr:hypothetical protein [Methylobacterium sp. Leaf102]